MTELDNAAILELLKQDAEKPARGTRARKDPTAERTETNWFKQYHFLDSPCQNPTCVDDVREPEDRGRSTTAMVKEVKICRYCFLAGAYGESTVKS